MKQIYRLMMLLLFSAPVLGAVCDGSKQHPCLVRDTLNNQVALKHFRTNLMLEETYHGNTKGLHELRLSGSSASSQYNWEMIYNKIQASVNHPLEKVIDVDLRQEDHGYLNNDAINLTSDSNWFNVGKSHDAVLRSEKEWLDSLAKNKTIGNVLTPEQFKTRKFSDGVTIPVKSVQSEKDIVEKIGFHYYRLTVTDHRGPLDQEVDRFLEIVKTIKPNTWLHLHCRGGDGRTTTFMAMYDMLHNANQVSFDEIIKRQAAVSPFYDLSNFKNKNKKFYYHYVKRYRFLREFYLFAQARLNGFNGNWSEWKKQR